MPRRVVVTGLGIGSPVGTGVGPAWANILAGHSGIARSTRFDAAAFPSQIAGEVKDFDVSKWLSAKEARRYDTFNHFGLVATMEAIADAGLDDYRGDKERVGVCIGSGIGGLPMIEETQQAYAHGGLRKISPFFVPGSIINMVAGLVSIHYGYKGPNLATVSACSTANHSLGEAARLIEYGDADIIVAGGSEACISPLGVGGFCAARALSTRNDDPATASRPWDVGRDGFVLGEGAGILVLEEHDHAKARGAPIYCELAGYGMSADAHHITAPPTDGDGARRSMINALRNARLEAHDIDYINAHGTSTPLGDLAECIAVTRTFGDHAKKLAVSSTKSMTGHLLGAAGGIAHFHRDGHQLVVVVSAMAGETNRLISLAHELSPCPSPRELDVVAATGEQVTIGLLAIALGDMGLKARSYTGGQVRVLTDSAFTKARILQIDEQRMREDLADGAVVVVAGFQGVDADGNITTLGRGGSDTSGVALAAALKADECQIYTDVDGVYTADPRIVPQARRLEKITFEEMLELASQGSKVLQIRSVEFAGKYKVNLRVLSSFDDPESTPKGTLITFEEEDDMEQAIISGIAFNRDEAKISLMGVEDRPGIAYSIVGPVAEANIDVDMIVQNIGASGHTDFSFTVHRNEYQKTLNG